jgi:hypothetical protein
MRIDRFLQLLYAEPGEIEKPEINKTKLQNEKQPEID